MEKTHPLKQMMQTNKMAFDYNYTMMMSAYEQNKLLLHTFLNQSPEISAETKMAIEDWLQGYRKGIEYLKKITDDGYQMVEKTMAATEK
jgi:predicted outer membrane protein